MIGIILFKLNLDKNVLEGINLLLAFDGSSLLDSDINIIYFKRHTYRIEATFIRLLFGFHMLKPQGNNITIPSTALDCCYLEVKYNIANLVRMF